MALRHAGRLFNIANRGLFTSSRLRIFGPEDGPNSTNLATGLEKREIVAAQAGDEDPFNLDALKRGPGTKDKPTLVPSAYDSRIVGCICDEDTLAVAWMWLHKGEPKRCMCGHWYQLAYKAPV